MRAINFFPFHRTPEKKMGLSTDVSFVDETFDAFMTVNCGVMDGTFSTSTLVEYYCTWSDRQSSLLLTCLQSHSSMVAETIQP